MAATNEQTVNNTSQKLIGLAGEQSNPKRKRRSQVWKLRGSLGKRQTLFFAALGLLLPFTLWWIAAGAGLVDKIFLPTPVDVAIRVYSWFTLDDLVSDIWISIYRVVLGFIISAIVALPLGLLISTFRPVQAFFEPLTDFIRYMPAVAFIPLVMLWIGIDESAKIAIIFIGTFFQMVLMIAEDGKRVPIAQIEAAQTMGAKSREILVHVIFQSAKPSIVDTFRITMGWGWTYLVVAELVAANSGLGYSILKAQRFLQTDKIFAGIILIGLIGLLTDQLFRLLHRKLFPWLATK